MKKITLFVVVVMCSSLSTFAQFSFPSTGPVTTLDALTPVTVPINDAANAAGVTSGTYLNFTVTCDWVNLDNAWSNEERLSIVTSAGATTPIAPSNGLGTTASVTGLTFSGSLFASYDPDSNGFLELSLTRTFDSDAQLSNIVVTISEPLYYGPPLGVSCSSGSSSFIFTENFESDPPAGWTGTGFSGTNGNWDITNANANSANTGPSIAYDNGSGMHLEYEASGNSSAIASAISPAIDLSSAVDDAELSFYLHAYGAAMGTLNVGVSNSATGPFTTVFTQNGQLQTAAGDAWVQFGVNLGSYVGQTIYIEFKHQGSGANFTGDMSIDFIRVEACDPPVCTPPNTQAVADATTGINSVTGNATVNWTAGADGDNVLVVMREGSAVDTDPIIGVAYTANSLYGTPTSEIGSENYVVYDGTKTTESVNISGLNQGTTYHFALYQYSTPDFCYNVTENVGDFAMPCATPIDVSALDASPGNEQITLDWVDSICFDEVLVIGKAGSSVTAVPSGDGSAYSANSYFGVGTEIATDEFVVYKGSSNNETITNLSNGTTYHFTVFTRIGSNWSTGVSINQIPNLDYCDVVGDLTYLTSITLVDFGSISNVTGQDSDDGYSDFTNLSTTVTKGASEDLTINLNTDGNFLVYSYVWIDWNQDGDFEDAGEAYDLGFAANTPDGPTDVSPLTINIPTTAAIGNTRMRVVCQYNDPPPAPIETLEPCLDSTDGEFEDYTINVTGSITYTYNNGWSNDPNGVATTNDNIIISSGDTNISSNTECNSLTINPGAGLTIDNGIVLNTSNGLSLESNSTSYSSLIANGTILGDVSYERFVNSQSGGNDLISAPLSGQTFGAFATANSNIFANPSDTSQKLFGHFDKPLNEYVIYDTDVPADANIVLGGGKGYRAASTGSGGTFTFSGTVNTGTVSENIEYAGSGEVEWNLVGNPFPSYLNVQAFLNHNVDSGVPNISLFNPMTAAIYGYDGDVVNGGWVIYNLANTTSTTVIAPGQGFFVSADPTKVAAYDLEFTSAMQSTGTSDDFFPGRNAELVFIKLALHTNTNSANTSFYFNPNASQSFDIGYDAEVREGDTSEFLIYSHLVENNTGGAIALQTLNSTDISNVTIPLGVNANLGEQITFSISDMNIPPSVNVYLDDVVANTTTLLNSSDYVITPTTELSGTGRFFLRTSDDALSTVDFNHDDITISALNHSKEIMVKGMLKENAKLELYDIQGKRILSITLNNSIQENHIDTSRLSPGVYIATVQNDEQQKTQKIILN